MHMRTEANISVFRFFVQCCVTEHHYPKMHEKIASGHAKAHTAVVLLKFLVEIRDAGLSVPQGIVNARKRKQA